MSKTYTPGSMTATQFAEAMIHINCIGLETFIELFAEQGEYQWKKFRNEFDGDVARWVRYLDLKNLNILWRYIESYLEATGAK